MSRLDIRINAGTKIIASFGGGKTITYEVLTDTDIDHLYDVVGRIEQFEDGEEH